MVIVPTQQPHMLKEDNILSCSIPVGLSVRLTIQVMSLLITLKSRCSVTPLYTFLNSKHSTKTTWVF